MNVMGILDTATKASDANVKHLKILIHGNSGSGKSTLCGTLPGKILYLWTERQGVISFQRTAPNASVLEIDGYSTLKSVFLELKKSGNCGGFDSVVMDSITEMQQLVVKEVCGGKKNPTLNDWGDIQTKTTDIVRAYRNLPSNVLITSLSEEFIKEDGKTIYRPLLAGKKLPATIPQYFNIVGYAYKDGNKDSVRHRVLLDGNSKCMSKSLPGLRYIEDPDVSYWYDRVFNNTEPRETESPTTKFPIINPSGSTEQDEDTK
jgi:hypothetical protein